MTFKGIFILSMVVFLIKFTKSEYQNSFDFLVEVRDIENKHKCFGTVISPRMIVIPASSVEGNFPNEILIMSADQQNLTSVENLPDTYYEKLISWYEDECEQLSLNEKNTLNCSDKYEYLRNFPRNDTIKIPEYNVHTISKIVRHPFYTINEQIFNVAVLVLNVPVSVVYTDFDQLILNLGYKISKDLEYHMAFYDLDTMYNRTYSVIKKSECESFFAHYSNATHFCVKSVTTENNLNETRIVGKSIINGQDMYGFVLESKINITEVGTEEIFLVLNIAKFISFFQAIEAGQDIDSMTQELQKITWSFVQKIAKQMMYT